MPRKNGHIPAYRLLSLLIIPSTFAVKDLRQLRNRASWSVSERDKNIQHWPLSHQW